MNLGTAWVTAHANDMGHIVILNYRATLSALFLLSLLQINSARGDDRLSTPDVAKAASVAYTRFVSELATRYSDHPILEETVELLEFSRDPHNYDMGVSQTDDLYIVVFLPRRVPPFENVVGGGGEYRIRKSDLSVVRSMGYK